MLLTKYYIDYEQVYLLFGIGCHIFVLWAIMVSIFVVMDNFGFKAGPVLFCAAFAIIFGIIGAMKPWLKKKLEKKYVK